MTEMDRMRIVENMFPDWREHLSDGKIIDYILEGLACRKSCSTDARDPVGCAVRGEQNVSFQSDRQFTGLKFFPEVEVADSKYGRGGSVGGGRPK